MQKNREKLSIAFLFDDTLDSSDGVAQYVKTLGAWLSSRGHGVNYLVGETKMETWAGGKIYSLSRNLPVSFNSNRLSIPLPAHNDEIKKVLERHKFNILHVQVPHSPMMSQKIINRASEETAVIGTFHILPAGRLAVAGSRVLRVIYLGGLKRFDRMLSVSPPAARFAQHFFGLSSKVVPNVIELDRFKPEKGTAPMPPVDILFLGRLVPRKGCQQLLEAFTLLHKRHKKVKMVIAGDGPERSKLEKYVANHGLERAVTFLGRISEADKPRLLSSAKIACFPSLYGESFGIVLIEAMAAGSGVVLGGDNPGYRSVLDSQPELLVNPEDKAAFARRLELLLKDYPLRRKLNVWQKRHVKQYDVSVVGPTVEMVYRQAIASRYKKVHN